MSKNKKPTVTAHCLVKNEENFIWYAIMSVLPYVDKMIVFDTGSTDKTVPIIKKILKTKEGRQKIHFEEKGEVDKQGHTDLRNEMIKMTKTDWFMILDGDEVWPDNQIKFLIYNDIPCMEILDRDFILISFHLCSVDLDHYTELGHYKYNWGLHGQLMPRVFANKPDVKFMGEYGQDTLYTGGEILLEQSRAFVSSAYFWHLSKLLRSSKSSSVFARNKPKNLTLLPHFLRKIFLKKSEQKPHIFNYENKIL